jgi:hypothetical protein
LNVVQVAHLFEPKVKPLTGLHPILIPGDQSGPTTKITSFQTTLQGMNSSSGNANPSLNFIISLPTIFKPLSSRLSGLQSRASKCTFILFIPEPLSSLISELNTNLGGSEQRLSYDNDEYCPGYTVPDHKVRLARCGTIKGVHPDHGIIYPADNVECILQTRRGVAYYSGPDDVLGSYITFTPEQAGRGPSTLLEQFLACDVATTAISPGFKAAMGSMGDESLNFQLPEISVADLLGIKSVPIKPTIVSGKGATLLPRASSHRHTVGQYPLSGYI